MKVTKDGVAGYTPPQTLAEFLPARIAEDEERIATTGIYVETRGVGVDDEGYMWTARQRAHWWQARALAECEAKRRIVALHTGAYWSDNVCAVDEELLPCETLSMLAQPYADHPDFREEWRA